jgi:pimeloyl-ACP methyl ester carboxylesterase
VELKSPASKKGIHGFLVRRHPDQPARAWCFACPNIASYCLEDFVEDVARVFRELSFEKAILIGLSMGRIVAQKFVLKYRHLVKAWVHVDTTSHGISPDAPADAFVAIADKRGEGGRGLKKAVQNLSDISFNSSASPATRKADRSMKTSCDARRDYTWIMCGRRPLCKKNLTFGLRSGASHVSGLFARHHDRWP